MPVTQKELKGILQQKYDLLIRGNYPAFYRAYPLTLYLMLKQSDGAVLARAQCTFIMHTIGTDSELARAGMSEKLFEKKYSKTEDGYEYASAFAWSIRSPEVVNLHISEFLAISRRKKGYSYQVTVPPTSWLYIIDPQKDI